jgi:hypothetical protein
MRMPPSQPELTAAAAYFPIPNWLKIRSSRSSVVVCQEGCLAKGRQKVEA